MRHCPDCRSEYRSVLATCPDCGAELREGPLPEQAEAPSPIPVVRLTTVSDPSAADVIRGVLAAEGIPAYVRRHGPISGELGRVTDGLTEDYAIIMVPESRFEEAQRLLSDLESATFQWPDGMAPDADDAEAE